MSANVLSHPRDPHVATLLFSCTAQACLLLSESQQRSVCECLECHFMVLLFCTTSQQNELHAVLTHSHKYRCISSNTHLAKLPLFHFCVCNRNVLSHTQFPCLWTAIFNLALHNQTTTRNCYFHLMDCQTKCHIPTSDPPRQHQKLVCCLGLMAS